MERRIRYRRKRVQINIKLLAGSFVTLVAVVLTIFEGPHLENAFTQTRTRISSKISSMMRLENVEWQELGSTNLSRFVNKELLWNVSGLKLGQEILPIDLTEIEKRLVAIPWVESIQL